VSVTTLLLLLLLFCCRTDNPYEANMFYIPAMTYAYSSNLGDTLVHAKRVIDYVRFTWPFFNRCAALNVLY
jgi:hypothetical protein